MIFPEGLFHFRVTLSRDSRGDWSGQAGPSLNRVPGIVGDRPMVVLRNGHMSLTRTEAIDAETITLGDEPVTGFDIATGPALACVLEPGDDLLVFRDFSGCCGIVVSRQGRLVIALGAVDSCVSEFAIQAKNDSRAEEVDLYSVLDWLALPGARLVWLDPAAADFTVVLESLDHLPADVRHVVVAARGSRNSAMADLNRRVMSGRARLHSRWFIHVPADFATESDWLDYLRTLPDSRPSDLVVRFTVNGRTTVVREGESAFSEPWHFAVQRVYTPGLPGTPTLVGVARAHPALSADAFLQSAMKGDGVPVCRNSPASSRGVD